MEHAHGAVSSLISLVAPDIHHDGPILSTELIARGVSQEKMLAFFTEH